MPGEFTVPLTVESYKYGGEDPLVKPETFQVMERIDSDYQYDSLSRLGGSLVVLEHVYVLFNPCVYKKEDDDEAKGSFQLLSGDEFPIDESLQLPRSGYIWYNVSTDSDFYKQLDALLPKIKPSNGSAQP